MTARTKKAAYHHGDLRQALVDAAVQVVAEGKIGSLSMRDIARRVGVSNAAPYHHFKGKVELLSAVAAEGFRLMNAEMERQIAGAGDDPRTRMDALGRGYVKFAVAHPAHYRVMFRSDLGEVADGGEHEVEGEACFGRLMSMSAERIGKPLGDPETRKLAVMCWTTVHGLASLWNDGALSAKFEDAGLDHLIDTVNAHLQVLADNADARG